MSGKRTAKNRPKAPVSRETTYFRELQFDGNIDESSRSVELSFSSENGVKRRDFWSGDWYDEILLHSPRSVQLQRLQELGVGLFNHDPDKVVGRLENVRLDEKEGKCRCRLVFDTDEFAENVYQKVRTGTLKGISVGYRVFKYEEVKEGKKSRDGFKGPAVVIRDWEPLEVSVVSCPADPTVGVGRSLDGKNVEERDVRLKFREKVQEALRKLNAGQLSREQFDAELRGILLEVDPEEMDEAARFISDVREASGDKEDDKKEQSDDEKEENEEDEEEKKEQSEDEEEKKEEKKEQKTGRSLRDERKRAAEISAVCSRFGVSPSDTARFISDGTPLVDVYRKVTEGSAKSSPNGISIGRAVTGYGEDERDKYRRAVSDGLRLRTGAQIEKPAPGAEDFRHVSLMELARDVLERNGESGIRRLPPMDIAARAFSTSDFPAIMSNLADVTLQAAYTEIPSTWRAWCRVGSAKDFKAQHLVRMGELPELEPVLENGEYKMADLIDTKDFFSIGTVGKKFSLSRQAIVNDDLGAFTRIPQLFGAASARTINRTVYRLLKSNPKIAEDGKAVFHGDHGNLGTAAALSIQALDEARVAMRRQRGLRKDKDAITLNLTPSFLVIPPELETLAMQILYSDTDLRYANANVKNPFRNAFTPIVEAELEAWEWYLTAAPTMIDTVEVAFLGGMQSPTLEQQQGWNVDGIEYKVRLDFGAWLYEYRGLYKNPGADPNV